MCVCMYVWGVIKNFQLLIRVEIGQDRDYFAIRGLSAELIVAPRAKFYLHSKLVLETQSSLRPDWSEFSFKRVQEAVLGSTRNSLRPPSTLCSHFTAHFVIPPHKSPYHSNLLSPPINPQALLFLRLLPCLPKFSTALQLRCIMNGSWSSSLTTS